jgi:hypothetical protein
VLGATYVSSYWKETYTVEKIHDNGMVTVRWHGDGPSGGGERRTTHCTHVGDAKRVA